MNTSTQIARPIEQEALGVIAGIARSVTAWVETFRASAKAADVAERVHYLTPSELARVGMTRDAMVRHAVDQIT